MKHVAMVWYWDMASQVYPQYRDGLKAAMELIDQKHEVTWFFDKLVPKPEEKFDFIFLWSDSNCPFIQQLYEYDCPKGLCYGSTFEPNLDNLRKFDVVYIENKPMFEFVRANGIHAIKAFGTDTDYYSPDDTKKTIEYFYPATFSPWKRQADIAYLGKDLTCCGYVQPDGFDMLNTCMESGVNVIPENLPAEKVRELYRKSKRVIMPAHFGGERTILEAMSCNVWPVVTNPAINRNANSYLDEYMEEKAINQDLTPREFIITHYSHRLYAKALMKGMQI